MLDLKDSTMSRRIWLAAGASSKPEGFKEYLDSLTDPMIQDRVLTGYCKILAATDGTGAMKTWAKLKPAKVLNYGMIEISRVLEENSDFAAINGMFPGDDGSLARLVRRDLLKRWATFRPDQAAAFALSHPDLAHPSQLGVIITRWAEKDPDAASKWINQAAAGPARDEGMAAFARHLTQSDPVRAWGFVKQIADPVIRMKTADMVAMEWRRTDPAAADRAVAEIKPPR